jgi:hypothetical protein
VEEEVDMRPTPLMVASVVEVAVPRGLEVRVPVGALLRTPVLMVQPLLGPPVVQLELTLEAAVVEQPVKAEAGDLVGQEAQVTL